MELSAALSQSQPERMKSRAIPKSSGQQLAPSGISKGLQTEVKCPSKVCIALLRNTMGRLLSPLKAEHQIPLKFWLAC